MITVIRVSNLLEPSRDRETREVPFDAEGNWKLVDYVGDRFEKDFTVSLNGHVWEPSLWPQVTPQDGDCIVISPKVGNSGLFRTLSSLALAVGTAALLATGVGAGLGVALGLSGAMATGVGAAIVAGAVGIAGNLVISAVSSLLTPSVKSQTPSYAFDGPHSLAQSGTVIPKGYGRFLSGGNVIASFVDVEGNDQYINALVCYGWGPARSINSLQINGKDISTYRNVQYYTRLGTNDQQPIPNFNRVVNGYPQQTQCLAGETVTIPGTGDLTQILQVDVQFPGGVFFQTADGNTIAAVVTYKILYALSGTSDWQPVLQPLTTSDVVSYDPITGIALIPHEWCVVATDMPPNSGVVYALDDGPHNPGDPWTGTMTVETFQANGNHGTYSKTFKGEWQRTNPLINQVLVLTWTDGYQDYVNATTQTCYNRTTIYGLAPGKYDVSVTKYGSARIHDDVAFGDNFAPNIGQDMWVHSVNEISLLDLAYPNMILVGVRALATSQLSGNEINILADITYGLRSLDKNILPAALQGYEEDNPACVAADMMLDPLYGGGQYPGIRTKNLNRYIDEWVAWANLNDELVDDGNGGSIRRHVFNGIFDNEDNLWNQANSVGQMSRAQIVPIARDYGVYVDQADSPVQIFSMGNIGADSFTETWMDLDSRANQVEIQFADKTRNYKQDNPIVYMDPANQDAGVAIKNVRLNGRGITLPAQAWHLARFRERGNQFLLRNGSFSCDVQAIACRQGNVIILQHDVPQWGWGGRTLPGSTASSLVLDRGDLDFVAGTSYSVIVLHPSLQRYAGTVSTAAPVIDGTGAELGVALAVPSFDDESRVTRAIVTPPGGEPVDCPITSASPGSIVVQPPPGFTPLAGMTFELFDTDVLETRTVTAVKGVKGGQVLTLNAPLSRDPQDFSVYFYGPTGSQKLARVTTIRRLSDQRAKIEWIDYGGGQYTDGTPTIGETSALVTTKPAVTSLTGTEQFQFVAGTNVPFVSLSWKLGPNTFGVAIYMEILTTGDGLSITNALPQQIARLTGFPTTFSVQAAVGQTVEFIVVGFDQNNNFAPFKTAPSVTITPVGVTTNLLLGSSFESGFTYWNIVPRAGDTFIPSFEDDGEAVYTIAGSALTTAQQLISQVIPKSKWAVGELLMLSGYIEDTVTDITHPNVGNIILNITFQDASGTTISTASVNAPLSGVTPTLTRFNTATTAVPAGTASLGVSIALGGTGIDLPVGSTVTMSHFLLENATTGQTVPSAWADLDVQGHVLDMFKAGSSTGLRVQGSVLPSFTGNFAFTKTDTTLTLTWTSIVILWPDGAFTFIQDGSLAFTGLTAATPYFIFMYFDIIFGGMHAAIPTTPIGTPALLSAAYDPVADAACKQDGRVALTPGGLSITTSVTGGSGGGIGGGSGGGPPIVEPIHCTVRGTKLPTPDGLVANDVLKIRFDAGEDVYLIGRDGPEKIVKAFWATVPQTYWIEVDGFEGFGCSASTTLLPIGGEHTWCSRLCSGALVFTKAGYRAAEITRVDRPGVVLHIELEGPSHEYQVVEGVWTHNYLKLLPPPGDS